MRYTTLGRTGLSVSVVGLGCGGPSRLGQRTGKSEQSSIALVRHALDLGVNFLDTAQSYETEEIVGRAIHGFARDQLVISTKITLPDVDDTDPAGAIRRGLEQSLRNMNTEYVDVYHLHGVGAERYDNAATVLAPTLADLKDEGKIRAIGITEEFPKNPGHAMLQRGLEDDYWDVVMVGFNMLNPSARERVFPITTRKGIGTLIMFAVRRALSQPAHLMKLLDEMGKAGILQGGFGAAKEAVNHLTKEGNAETLMEAAYRFCVHEPGADVVLVGTGERKHLDANIEAALKPPLPHDVLEKLARVFGRVDSVTGN